MMLHMPTEDLLGLTAVAELTGAVRHPGLRAELRAALGRMLVIIGADNADAAEPTDNELASPIAKE